MRTGRIRPGTEPVADQPVGLSFDGSFRLAWIRRTCGIMRCPMSSSSPLHPDSRCSDGLSDVFWRFELNNRIFVHRVTTAKPATSRTVNEAEAMPADRLHLYIALEPE
jgi:hypothetical protein